MNHLRSFLRAVDLDIICPPSSKGVQADSQDLSVTTVSSFNSFFWLLFVIVVACRHGCK